MTKVNKQDSNSTGLRYAEEVSLGVLAAAASQFWYPAEPNSYSDFGGQIKTVARNPINASRQNQKGVTVDLDASGGYNSDFTATNMDRLLQGFMFADWREPFDTQSYNHATTAVSAVATTSTFKMSYGDNLASVIAGHIIHTNAFTNAANNGQFVVASKASVAATGVLTSSNNYSDGDTVLINGRTYTFQSSLTNVDGHVKVGGSEATSIGNLAKAINLSGVAGTDYAAAQTINASVSAVAAAHALTITAKRTGYAANAYATTVGGGNTGNGAWGGAVMTGGQADIVVVETSLAAEASPPAAARIQVVGYQFDTASADIVVSGSLPVINRASGADDYTGLGVIPGQFVFIGGDAAGVKFVNASNNGWARIRSVTASAITFDKTTSTMAAETGTGLTVNMYFGKVLKNESDPTLIKRRSFTLERDLGIADTSVVTHQSEQLPGSVPNEMTLNVKQADKLNADLTFVSTDHTTRTQAQNTLAALAVIAGSAANAPAIVSEDAFNTSSHVSRLRMTILSETNANPDPLFAYLTEFTVVVNNNVQPNKAVSVLGAFDQTAGQFDVSGKVTAYFADVTAVEAVRSNADVSLDFIFARDNYGFAYDIPLTALGDGRLTVEQNNPITLPLDLNAGADRHFNHTLLLSSFPYLPNAAM